MVMQAEEHGRSGKSEANIFLINSTPFTPLECSSCVHSLTSSTRLHKLGGNVTLPNSHLYRIIYIICILSDMKHEIHDPFAF